MPMGELPYLADLLLWEAGKAEQQVKHGCGRQLHEQTGREAHVPTDVCLCVLGS